MGLIWIHGLWSSHYSEFLLLSSWYIYHILYIIAMINLKKHHLLYVKTINTHTMFTMALTRENIVNDNVIKKNKKTIKIICQLG